MIDWNTETRFRCTACQGEYHEPAVAVRCHQAPTVAVVECSNCGREFTAEVGRLAAREADGCCRAANEAI